MSLLSCEDDVDAAYRLPIQLGVSTARTRCDHSLPPPPASRIGIIGSITLRQHRIAKQFVAASASTICGGACTRALVEMPSEGESVAYAIRYEVASPKSRVGHLNGTQQADTLRCRPSSQGHDPSKVGWIEGSPGLSQLS
eukprot:scaffold47638_cov30-Tisochrysis_lutea.AAC.3